MKIDKWSLFEISREKINFTRGYGLDHNFELLTQILPVGSAPGQSVKCAMVDNIVFFSYLKMNGQKGVGITLGFGPEEIPNTYLGFLPKMKSFLETNPPDSAPLDINPEKISLPPSIKIRDFDSAIFSLVTGFPTVILGNEAEILELMQVIDFSIPQELRARFRFVTQSTSLSENVNIIGMPFSEEVLSELNVSKGKYTIVVLGDRTYGQLSSKLCKKIANHLVKGEYNQISDLLLDFYQLATESDELLPSLTFADKYRLHLSDAQLALILRAKHFDKQVPDGLGIVEV
ncbi:MAG: hypothetical protein ACFFBD_21655 [Candidatus Hodarchaeota archaeon]